MLFEVRAVAAIVGASPLLVLASCAALAGLDDYQEGGRGAPETDAGDSAIPDVRREDRPPPPVDAPIDNGTPGDRLVAFLPFDEGSGNTSADKSGNGHNATLRAMRWFEREGGFAVSTQSPDGEVDIPTLQDKVFPQSAGTLTFLFGGHSGVPLDAEGVIDVQDATRNHLYLRQSPNSTERRSLLELGLQFKSPAGDPVRVTRELEYDPDQLLRVAITWDTALPRVILRVAERTVVATDDALRSFQPDAQRMHILEQCNCAIDELRVYARAMTEEEVKALPR